MTCIVASCHALCLQCIMDKNKNEHAFKMAWWFGCFKMLFLENEPLLCLEWLNKLRTTKEQQQIVALNHSATLSLNSPPCKLPIYLRLRLGEINREIKIEVFSISREPRTSRSHVTSALAWGLQFEFHVCTSRPLSCGKSFTARFFFHSKTSKSHFWAEILLLKTISPISYGIVFHGNLILKTISQLKQKWTTERKQTW